MPQHPTRPSRRLTLSRRTFLGAAGGASLALGANLLGGATASAAVPAVGSFDLTAGSLPFLEGALTADTHHTMQSFCFDPNNSGSSRSRSRTAGRPGSSR